MPIFKVIHRSNSYIADTGMHKYHDDKALETVINYCQDSSKTGGMYVGGYGINIEHAAYEMHLLAWSYGADKGLRLRHWILAFTKDEVRQFGSSIYPALDCIAKQAASYYRGQYQIVYAVHMDRNHPHIHFVMSTVNYATGRKYLGNKADYYGYQNFLREVLVPYGMRLLTVSDDGNRSEFENNF